MINKQKVTLHNYFEFYKNGEQIAQAHNIVLDRFYKEFFCTHPYDGFNGIAVGSGEGTPTPDRMGLFKLLKTYQANSNKTFLNIECTEAKYTGEITIGLTDLVGSTITEIGVYINNSNGVVTHAMLKDMEGNPIQINKTDLDTITIRYTVYLTWDISNFNDYTYVVGSIFGISGVYNTGSFISGRLNKNVTLRYTRFEGGIRKYYSGRLDKTDLNDPTGITKVILSGTVYDIYKDPNFPFQRLENQPLGTGDGVTTGFNSAFYGCCDPVVYVDGVQVTNFICNPLTVTTNIDTNKVGLASFMKRISETGEIYPPYSGALSRDVFYIFENLDTENISVIAHDPDYVIVYVSESLDGEWIRLTQKNQRSNAKYVKIKTGYTANYAYVACNVPGEENIIFDTPPAEGAVITIDYTPRCIPKCDQNVVDVDISGEYTY